MSPQEEIWGQDEASLQASQWTCAVSWAQGEVRQTRQLLVRGGGWRHGREAGARWSLEDLTLEVFGRGGIREGGQGRGLRARGRGTQAVHHTGRQACHSGLFTTFRLHVLPHFHGNNPSTGLPALPLAPGSSLDPLTGLPDSSPCQFSTVILIHSDLRSHSCLDSWQLPGLLRKLWGWEWETGTTSGPSACWVLGGHRGQSCSYTCGRDISVVCCLQPC